MPLTAGAVNTVAVRESNDLIDGLVGTDQEQELSYCSIHLKSSDCAGFCNSTSESLKFRILS